MTKYKYIRICTVEEMAREIYKLANEINEAKKLIANTGIDPNDHERWIRVIIKNLEKEKWGHEN